MCKNILHQLNGKGYIGISNQYDLNNLDVTGGMINIGEMRMKYIVYLASEYNDPILDITKIVIGLMLLIFMGILFRKFADWIGRELRFAEHFIALIHWIQKKCMK